MILLSNMASPRACVRACVLVCVHVKGVCACARVYQRSKLTLADGGAHFIEERVEVVEAGGDEDVVVDRVTGDGPQLRVVNISTDADSHQVNVLASDSDGL